MRNKGIARTCSRDGLNLNIWLQTLILDSLNSQLFGFHIYTWNRETNQKIQILISRNSSGRNICIQGTWLLTGFMSCVQMKRKE